MPTECTPELFGFPRVEDRSVVGAFDGGAITSEAGGLLLGATDRAIRLVDWFAGCFVDRRRGDLIEHQVTTLVGQRVSAQSGEGHRSGGSRSQWRPPTRGKTSGPSPTSDLPPPRRKRLNRTTPPTRQDQRRAENAANRDHRLARPQFPTAPPPSKSGQASWRHEISGLVRTPPGFRKTPTFGSKASTETGKTIKA